MTHIDMVRLLYANTRNADMRYAVGMDIPDDFFYLETDEKKFVFLDHREIGVFEGKNTDPSITAVLSTALEDAAIKLSVGETAAQKLALQIIKEYGLENQKIEVPVYFPLDLADFLRAQGIEIVSKTEFFPQRVIKSAKEVQQIRENIAKTTGAFQRIEEILRESIIEGEKVFFNGEELTSEFIKLECDRVLLEEKMFNEMNIIISSGAHTALPHHVGAGIIHPHVPIICDIFPRNRDNGYFADMTRTYVKGVPTEMFKKMYDAVLEAQEVAIRMIKPGIKTKAVHAAVEAVFIEGGFHVRDLGFVHGTGHGLGLDVHEAPLINARSEEILRPGNVVTVEPGLYYADHGGVRIEDVVHVTENGCENLTNYPKDFIIP